MKLTEIKKDLTKLGYIIKERKDKDLVFLQCSAPIENNKIMAFGIAIENEKFSFWDASQQKATSVLFGSKTDLINHIKSHFSIN
jgi:hypothetical protein